MLDTRIVFIDGKHKNKPSGFGSDSEENNFEDNGSIHTISSANIEDCEILYNEKVTTRFDALQEIRKMKKLEEK